MFLDLFLMFWAPLGPGMGPKCAPGDQLSNPRVSSKSGQLRPDWWQTYGMKKSQEPAIVGASYSNRGVIREQKDSHTISKMEFGDSWLLLSRGHRVFQDGAHAG